MFFAWVLVANILGKTVNGEIGVIRSTVNLFISFVGTGFGITLTKYIASYINSDTDRINRIISLNLIASFILSIFIGLGYYALIPYISEELLFAPHLEAPLRISVILLLLSIYNGVLLGVLQGFSKFRAVSFINAAYGVFLFVAIYFGSVKFGINGTFIGFSIAMFLSLVLAFIVTIKTLKKNNVILTLNIKEELPILLNFTAPVILSGLMVVPFKWYLDTLLVRQDNGYNEMGLFTALFLFHTLILMTANTLNAPFITMMSSNNNIERINKLNLVLPWSLGIFAAVPILMFPEIIGILFGSEYVNDKNFDTTIVLIIIITVLVMYKNGMARIMIVNNLMWFSFVSNLLWGVVIITHFILTPNKDAVGLSLSYIVAYVVNILFILPLYVKKGIIPMSLIKSKESIVIWVLFSTLVFISFRIDHLSIIIRLIFLFLFIIMFSILFYKLLKFKESEEI